MLNPNLKLNQKIFDEGVEQRATREGFGEGLVKLGEKNPNVVVLTADLSESTKADGFEKKFPARFFNAELPNKTWQLLPLGLE